MAAMRRRAKPKTIHNHFYLCGARSLVQDTPASELWTGDGNQKMSHNFPYGGNGDPKIPIDIAVLCSHQETKRPRGTLHAGRGISLKNQGKKGLMDRGSDRKKPEQKMTRGGSGETRGPIDIELVPPET
jgi:hypothetical protein